MTAQYSLDCWQRCEVYYRSLWCHQSTDHDGGRAKGVFGSMHGFVEHIAPAAIAEDIHPGTAHAWLFLRKGESVQVKRLVYLLCDQTGNRFAISWRKDGRPVMFTVKAMDNARWQRIVTWLDLQDRTEA